MSREFIAKPKRFLIFLFATIEDLAYLQTMQTEQFRKHQTKTNNTNTMTDSQSLLNIFGLFFIISFALIFSHFNK